MTPKILVLCKCPKSFFVVVGDRGGLGVVQNGEESRRWEEADVRRDGREVTRRLGDGDRQF